MDDPIVNVLNDLVKEDREAVENLIILKVMGNKEIGVLDVLNKIAGENIIPLYMNGKIVEFVRSGA